MKIRLVWDDNWFLHEGHHGRPRRWSESDWEHKRKLKKKRRSKKKKH